MPWETNKQIKWTHLLWTKTKSLSRRRPFYHLPHILRNTCWPWVFHIDRLFYTCYLRAFPSAHPTALALACVVPTDDMVTLHPLFFFLLSFMLVWYVAILCTHHCYRHFFHSFVCFSLSWISFPVYWNLKKRLCIRRDSFSSTPSFSNIVSVYLVKHSRSFSWSSNNGPLDLPGLMCILTKLWIGCLARKIPLAINNIKKPYCNFLFLIACMQINRGVRWGGSSHSPIPLYFGSGRLRPDLIKAHWWEGLTAVKLQCLGFFFFTATADKLKGTATNLLLPNSFVV